MAKEKIHTPRVSYCTTSKGRFEHVRETLPANMKAEEGNPHVEFVLLDYGDTPELGSWVKEQCAPQMAQGTLRYVRSEQDYFRMAHAKNMAHRMATGDVLCNLDADNFIVPGFAAWLQERFAHNPRQFVSSVPLGVMEQAGRKLGALCHVDMFTQAPPGVVGRMALSRDDFVRLGGYNERYNAWGGEDLDLALRARGSGLAITPLPAAFHGHAIQHDDALRMAEYSPAHQEVSMRNLAFQNHGGLAKTWARMSQFARHHAAYVHEGNVGCGSVQVNFGQPVELGALSRDSVEQWAQRVHGRSGLAFER